MSKEAAIDNDFLCHIAEIKLDNGIDLNELVKKFFAGMDVAPIIHTLVYKNESNDAGNSENTRNRINSFLSDNILSIKEKNEIVPSKAKEIYYQTVFEELYREFKGDIPENIKDIWEDWEKKASFGETHTVAMCCLIECGIFLSDDHGANLLKKIIAEKYNFAVEVYDRSEAVRYVQEHGKNNLVKWERKVLKHK